MDDMNIVHTRTKKEHEDDQPSLSSDMMFSPGSNRNDSFSVFKDLKFTLKGFGVKNFDILSHLIKENQGTVISTINKETEADIVVVPLCCKDRKISAKTVVTNCWIEKCVEQRNCLDFNSSPLFSPLLIHSDGKPLANFVITVTQFEGVEREALKFLIEFLGATYQDDLVEMDRRELGLFRTTHLIAKHANGKKFLKAKQWNIEVVTIYWLLETAQKGELQVTDLYSVETKVKFDVESGPETARNIPLTSQQRECDYVAETDFESNNDTDSDDFLSSSHEYRPYFEVQDLLISLDSPHSPIANLEEAFSRNLSIALKRFQPDDEITEGDSHESLAITLEKSVLNGVAVCISKKLEYCENEISQIVLEKGGSVVECVDNCTHYVFRGTKTDSDLEFQLAQEKKLKVVAPEWLFAIKYANSRIDEALYPHNYDQRPALTREDNLLSSFPNSPTTPSVSFRDIEFESSSEITPNTEEDDSSWIDDLCKKMEEALVFDV